MTELDLSGVDPDANARKAERFAWFAFGLSVVANVVAWWPR